MKGNERDTMQRLLDEGDAPPWADEVFKRAEVREGATLIKPASGTLRRRGRPRLQEPKRQVTLRLDPQVVDHFRATGRGWQSRINDFLKKAIET